MVGRVKAIWWRSVVLMLVAVSLAPSPTQAQADHGTGVAFLSTIPLVFYQDKSGHLPPASPVEVFNGSSRRETIRVIPSSALGATLMITPGSQAIDPGSTATFSVSAVDVDTAKNGELLALSTDGTI